MQSNMSTQQHKTQKQIIIITIISNHQNKYYISYKLNV